MASSVVRRIRLLTVSASRIPLVTSVRTNYVKNDPNYKHHSPTFTWKYKHYNPKFRSERKNKVIKVDLPDQDEAKKSPEDYTPDERRAKMKKLGIQPQRPWQEKPMFVAATASTFEQYIPPEGDGKMAALSAQGAKQKLEFLEKKGKSMAAIRKVRQFDEEFDPKHFVNEAQQIYIDAHNALAEFNKERLHQLVTERAYPLMIHKIRNKTLRWNFIKSLEPPQAVHVRNANIVTSDNIFAQVTVRFHTKQTLAIYDRFGRLEHGSDVVAKDVLEYVVFEKHIANTYGTWRLHDKIIPDWMPPRQPVKKTYRVVEEPEDTVEEETVSSTASSTEAGDQKDVAVATA